MRIFCTGGTGFIGSHFLQRLLQGGHEVLTLSGRPQEEKKNIAWVEGHLEDMAVWQEGIKQWKPEAVVHLAWEGIPDASETLAKKNFEMSLKLMNIAGEIECKIFLGIGSSLEYGGLEGKVSEEEQGVPPNPLYKAKARIYKEGKKKAESFGMKFIWARLFYVYGPGQREGSLIPHLIASYKKGEEPEIKNPDGANDFIYVQDVAGALALLLEKNAPQGIYNIGSGHLTSVRDIIKAVAKALNKPLPELPPSRTSSTSFYADISKIEKATGWEPSTRLEEGIKSMII